MLSDPTNIAFDEVLYPGLTEEALDIELAELKELEMMVGVQDCGERGGRSQCNIYAGVLHRYCIAALRTSRSLSLRYACNLPVCSPASSLCLPQVDDAEEEELWMLTLAAQFRHIQKHFGVDLPHR